MQRDMQNCSEEAVKLANSMSKPAVMQSLGHKLSLDS